MSVNISSWQDEEMLDLLRFADDNLTYTQIAQRLGKTVGQVAGMLKRIRSDLEKSEVVK